MKRLWISVAILLTLLVSTLCNSWYLNDLIADFEQKLTTAHELSSQDHWDTSRKMTQQVMEHWQKHDFYFHVMLPHRDIDEIHLTLREVWEYLELEETDQYNAANAKLIAQLGLLAEMERLSLKNVL